MRFPVPFRAGAWIVSRRMARGQRSSCGSRRSLRWSESYSTYRPRGTSRVFARRRWSRRTAFVAYVVAGMTSVVGVIMVAEAERRSAAEWLWIGGLLLFGSGALVAGKLERDREFTAVIIKRSPLKVWPTKIWKRAFVVTMTGTVLFAIIVSILRLWRSKGAEIGLGLCALITAAMAMYWATSSRVRDVNSTRDGPNRADDTH